VHELAVCQGLVDEIARVARAQGADEVQAVTVAVGALAGVESGLLERAFVIARAGTVAAQARLQLQSLPARVACSECGAEAEVAPNRLLCPACGGWRVRVVGGEELLLIRVELTRAVPAALQVQV
jgi:hydrogenase nickel incorporation protein HypA/HybF